MLRPQELRLAHSISDRAAAWLETWSTEHAFGMLTEAEAERLLTEGAVLTDDVRWTPQRSNPRWMQFAAFLDSAADTSLRLVMALGTINPSKYTILVLRGEQVIRRLDVRGSHGNPPGASGQKWVAETHKHRWTDHFADKVAYTPPDIDTPVNFQTSEYETTFRAFCAESNIRFTGSWQDPPTAQEELDL